MHLESLHLPTNKQKDIPASKIILLVYSLDSSFTPKTRGMSFSLLCHPSLTHPLTIPINIYINAPIFVKQLCWFCIYLLLWIHFCFLLRKCLLNIFSQILSSSTTSGFSAKDNQDSVLPTNEYLFPTQTFTPSFVKYCLPLNFILCKWLLLLFLTSKCWFSPGHGLRHPSFGSQYILSTVKFMSPPRLHLQVPDKYGHLNISERSSLMA